MAGGAHPPAATDETIAKPGHVPGFCMARNRKWVLVAAILASALGFIDGTLVAIALPAMRADLGASLAEALWINTGYLLPLSALILTGGAMGDRFGLVRIFAAGIALFLAASLACALAPTPEILIVARVVQGIGAAAMIPGSLALITRAYPPAERGRAIGQWAAASALTTALGPILAGVALSLGGDPVWRWLFAINLPLGALALWLILTRTEADPARPDHPLDPLGAGLVTAGLGLVTLALIGGGEEGGLAYPWAAAAGFALLAAFVAWQARAPHPMVPLRLFGENGFAAANAATALIYFALSAVMFFLPMTLIAGRGFPEWIASAAFAPMMVAIPLLSTTAGRWSDRAGAGTLIGIGAAVVAVAYAALAAVVGAAPFWTGILPATALMGLGMALVVAPLSAAIMAAVPEDSAGLASGINNAVSRIAGLVSVAALGAQAAVAYAQAGGAESFGEASDLTRDREATIAGFRAVALAAAACCAAGAVIGWRFVPRA